VREIFISPKRNRYGKRYGVVRFKGVQDAHHVEKKLDSMVFGGLKMYVNTPKFGRPNRGSSDIAARGRAEGKQYLEGSRNVNLSTKPGTKASIYQGSYAEVVRRQMQKTE